MTEHFTWQQILIAGNQRVDSRTLRPYFDLYRNERGIAEECAIDGCPTRASAIWLGKPLPLELDHKNGNECDNRPDNLRLLCPICHRQQPTDKAKNIGHVELLAEKGEKPTGRSFVLHENDGTDRFTFIPTGFRALPTITCPVCGDALVSHDYDPNGRGGAPNASDFESCLRRCEKCGIGLSNSRHADDVVRIFRDIDHAIPEFVRGAVESVLEQAMNVRNRAAKRIKFCSESSEDAVTWSVFVGLQRAARLREILANLGCGVSQAATNEPTMLLWGVPVPSDAQNGIAIRDRLLAIADEIGEHINSRSEPDVVLDFGEAGVVIIEVKHRSANESKDAQYRGWKKYLDQSPAFLKADEVRKTGMYELARNWRFAWDLAGQRPLSLVNLGPEGLSADNRLNDFRTQLNHNDQRQFQLISWKQLRGAIGVNAEWLLLNAWLDDRGVV